jgi:hypothetical protein
MQTKTVKACVIVLLLFGVYIKNPSLTKIKDNALSSYKWLKTINTSSKTLLLFILVNIWNSACAKTDRLQV